MDVPHETHISDDANYFSPFYVLSSVCSMFMLTHSSGTAKTVVVGLVAHRYVCLVFLCTDTTVQVDLSMLNIYHTYFTRFKTVEVPFHHIMS